MARSRPAWLGSLVTDAPGVVAIWEGVDADYNGLDHLRREMAARAGPGSAARSLAEQEAVGDALETVLDALPDSLLTAPGGEADWNVAQAFAHATAARRFLGTWAALDAGGTWPTHRPPTVTPSVPGRPDASREELRTLLDKSRRAIREAAGRIAGHEVQRCGLEHPLVGRLRCGEWLLFLGVHDLMHLEQLHGLLAAESA